MAKRERLDPKAALGQQEAELRRSGRGKQFVGDDVGAARGRAAERAKVHELQREYAVQLAHEERLRRPLWEGVAGLVLDGARVAGALVRLPFRMARLPFRVAASLMPRWGHT